MKDEYDFSKAERGKFYRPGAKLHLPVYLDEEVQKAVNDLAGTQGLQASEVVNRILRQKLITQPV